MTMLNRLLGSLHRAVFDTSPDSDLAFFIRHKDGVTWSVADEKLVATVNGFSKSYALDKLTLGQLAGQMVIDGFEVQGLSSEFSGLSASVLIEGSGNSLKTGGDRLYAFRDLLRVIFGGYARELRTAKVQMGEAIKQMVITQSEGEWLDLWGGLYNTPRPKGMTDAKYQSLIPQEAFRLRVNGYAIEKAIFDLTGQVVHIEEPWTDMFRLDTSRLSSLHRFYDGDSVGYHIIRPVADEPIVWDGIIDIIERNKAAGVIVLPPEERNRTFVRDPLVGKIWAQRWSMIGNLVRTSNLPYLDNTLRLSDYTIDRNYLTAITSLQMLSSLVDEINGTSMEPIASHTLAYGPAVYEGVSSISPWHTGFYAAQNVEMYPTGKRTWRSAVVWKHEQSWKRPYSFRTMSRMTSYSSTAFARAAVDGSTVSSSDSGIDWTQGDWDNGMEWQGNAPDQT